MKIKLLIFLFLSLGVISSALGNATNYAFYQDLWSDQSLKTFFLRRIANDIQPGDVPYVDVRNDYNALIANLPKGVYVHTANAGDLDALFTDIARRIQLRLVK